MLFLKCVFFPKCTNLAQLLAASLCLSFNDAGDGLKFPKPHAVLPVEAGTLMYTVCNFPGNNGNAFVGDWLKDFCVLLAFPQCCT